MKQSLLLFLIVLTAGSNKAQQVNWAINVPQPGANINLTVDRSSNVYLYHYSQHWNSADANEGTYISKYTSSGVKIFDLHLQGKVYLTHMLNDGKGSFYFTGFFKDTVNVQGTTLITNGLTDGLFGKMNEDGQVAWVAGFGGAKHDKATNLTFNHDSTGIVLTGGVDSTVYLYKYPIITTTKAIIVIALDLNGKLVQYKTHSFHPNQYGDNIGLEIGTTSAGYFLLADKMGEHWSNEPFPAGTEMEGRYMLKLDNNFNISWSQFIISSACYYGYSCNNMAVCNNDAYIPSFCSGKYGGTGHFDRLNNDDGSKSWFLTNQDGQYYDSHPFEGRVFFVGNEEVNGCPCESNDAGNAKVKVVDRHNTEEILFSKYHFQFYNITHAINGSIYVFGHTHSGEPELGGFAINKGYFLFSLKDPTTGIQQVATAPAEVLNFFPNPSQGDLKIESQYNMDEVTVYNLNGGVMFKTAPHAKTCSLQGIPGGCYALQVKTGDKYTTSKIVVTN